MSHLVFLSASASTVVFVTLYSYCYSAVNGFFWPVEDLAELSDGTTGCDEVVRVGIYLQGY